MTTATSFYDPSRAMVLPADRPEHIFGGRHYIGPVDSYPPPHLHSMPERSNLPTYEPIAGRKRSRGNIYAPEEDEERGDDGANVMLAAEELQSNTGRKQFQLSRQSRPTISSRKSQRTAAGTTGCDDLAQLVLPPQIREVTAEPLIDEATRMLGISWTRMDSSDALRISQAAYSKWIKNHYPGLTNIAVWFENSAIPGYLVEACSSRGNGYYIFSEDLTEARLVTTEPSQLLPRLRMLPALHLAAPGGHIGAETESTVIAPIEFDAIHNVASVGATQASQGPSLSRGQSQELDGVRGDSAEPQQMNGMCSAHEMDLD